LDGISVDECAVVFAGKEFENAWRFLVGYEFYVRDEVLN